MGLFGNLAGPGDIIGIDIGSHSIKVVQVANTRTGYTLTRAGSTPTPHEAVKQGVVEDRVAIAEALRTLLRTLGITTTSVVAAVAGPTVVVRQVKLPNMTEQQLRKSIYWEARNFISFPVEDSLLEFQILGTSTNDGTPQMDVMLVATPRILVDSRVEALELAGLDPIAIELEPFALMRAVIDLPNGTLGTQETVALVDIGSTFTHISIISNGSFVLSRSVNVAGQTFTGAIATVLGIETMQAEEIKENELRVVTDEFTRAQLSPVGQEASRALESPLEELVREIRRSFAFYDYQQGPGGTTRTADGVSRIVLTGGSAKMIGLDTFLNSQLSIPVEIVDLFRANTVQLPPDADPDELRTQVPLMATAFGLALREPMLLREKVGYR